MYLKSYKVITGDTLDTDSKTRTVSSLNRDNYMTAEYSKLVKEYTNSVICYGKSALLYAGGPVNHHSDGRNVKGLAKAGSIAIKSQAGMSLFNVAKSFVNVGFEYASINGNTCASSMHSIYEAYRLIHKEQYDTVIVYAADMVEDTQLLLFKQLDIDLVCGDGIAILEFSKEKCGLVEIEDAAWVWNNDPSPMTVTKDGYLKVLKELECDEVNYVKPHGTRTGRNDVAEIDALNEYYDEIPEMLYYKDSIGHTQGASSAIELGMFAESRLEGRCVMLASGLGGFYGGCTVRRLNEDSAN